MTTEFNVHNYLDSLPSDIKSIEIYNKNLTYLPSLSRFTQLTKLNVSYNNLTYLPKLPNNLLYLYCFHNKLTCLPELPDTLLYIYCCYNPFIYDVESYDCYKYGVYGNNIYDIDVYDNEGDIEILNHDIKIVNSFRRLFYCLKFKKQFMRWLWERIRLPKIKFECKPENIVDKLYNEIDDDILL